ncbi:DUF3426 domain-containing protein [Marinobacter nauticus]|uniref:Zinc finger/thioredoxin putative domain-containing protein n=1 Tax=Marinobacter nauticus TaxID=2743 RepID=A0A1M2UUY4_MARNT|nr:DUF3426 domain-containing protein [Marinobacter nauticus]OJS99155.1 hypothetical protein BEE62_03015 [Marinobacter nauticus]
MTQSSLQTQCPNCETRFRVTDEQLSIAGGKVRCGSCLKVFNAIEHQVVKSTGSAAPAATGGQAAGETPPPPADTHAGHDEEDFIFADNPEEDATEGRYAGSKLTFSDDELSDSFRSFDEPEESGYHDDDLTPEKQDVDESWAEAMLADDQPARAPKAPAEPEPQAPEPENKPEPDLQLTPPDSPASGTPDAAGSEETPEPPAPGKSKSASPAAAPEELTLAATDDDRPAAPKEPARRADQAPDTLYRDLRRDPVSVGQGGTRLRTALWTLVVVALLGALVAQVTWFQFDRLSAIPQLRPFYEKGCELAGCQLKPLINVEAIQSRKLVVRTDPDNRTQLIVDAVIINRATFEQPFPAIALTFSNLNGDVVAQSTFTPAEYLAGEAESLGAMPSETPVRIAISIRDPGRDAVNYNLSFRPWTP